MDSWLGEVEGAVEAPVDLVCYMRQPHSVEGAWCLLRHTALVPLDKTDEELLQGMARGTRYEVRRADSRDDLTYRSERVTSLADLDEFIEYYGHVVEDQGAPKLRPSRIEGMATAGVLDLSHMTAPDGTRLTWHLHLSSCGGSILMHSISSYGRDDSQEHRNLCGRANRLHHWLDMRQLRDQGSRVYDFGGIYVGKAERPKLEHINRFKMSFGGDVTPCYNCFRPVSPLGRVAVWGGRAFDMWRRATRSRT